LLTHPTHAALSALKLDGMAEAFAELITEDRGRSLDPPTWLGRLDRADARPRAGPARHSPLPVPAARRQPPPQRRLHGGRELPRAARSRPCAVPKPRDDRVDRPAPFSPDHRALRGGQVLARLRARPCREPRRSHRPLSSPTPALRRPRARARRRALRPAVSQDRPRRPADPRRLGPRSPDRPATPGPDGDPNSARGRSATAAAPPS